MSLRAGGTWNYFHFFSFLTMPMVIHIDRVLLKSAESKHFLLTYQLVTHYSQVSFISSRASRLFQVSRSPPRPTISLSRDTLRSTRKKCEDRGRGAFSWYVNWGSGGSLSRLEINKTLSFLDTWNKRDLIEPFNVGLVCSSLSKMCIFKQDRYRNFSNLPTRAFNYYPSRSDTFRTHLVFDIFLHWRKYFILVMSKNIS